MRTKVIVRADVRLADVAEVLQAAAQEVVRGLMAPNPRFRERVRIWCQERRPDSTHAGTVEQTTKSSRELGVAIMDEEPYVELLVLEPHHHLSPLLPNPPIVWMICGRAEKHLRVQTWMNVAMAITSATRPTQGRPPARQHAVRGNLNLSGVFGDKDVGDPVEYEHLRLVQTSAVVEREIFNRGIALVMTEGMRAY